MPKGSSGDTSAPHSRKNGSMNARLIVGSAVLGLSLAGGLTTLDAAHASPSLAHRMKPVQSSMAAPRPDARIIVVRKAGGEGHGAIISILGKKRASSSA